MDPHEQQRALAVLCLYLCMVMLGMMAWQGPDDEQRPPPRP